MSRVEISSFGETESGLRCKLYALQNADGTCVKVSDIGATMVEFRCADRNGIFDNILLRHQDGGAYLTKGGFLGAVVGPYANRIGGASMTIDGVDHVLEANQGNNTLHGGAACFAYKQWTCEICDVIDGVPTLLLTLCAFDGDAGFPGNLQVSARFELLGTNVLSVQMKVESDCRSAVSLTQHPYFNLAGVEKSAQALLHHHRFAIDSKYMLDVDDELVPSGKLTDVTASCFDFTEAKGVMDLLQPLSRELKKPCGFDHNYCFEPWSVEDASLRLQATAFEATSGRRLEVYSTLPGLQFYTGNHLLEAGFERHEGFCLEPQFYPDSPNKKTFPFSWTEPGKPFAHTIQWRLGVDS